MLVSRHRQHDYSFFEELSDRLLPPLPLLFDIVLEDDSEMIFQNDAIGWRLVVTTMQRWVPRLMLSPEGQKAVNEQFFKPTKWRYLKEMLAPSSSRREVEGMVKLLLPGMQLTQNKKSGWVLYELDRLQLHRFFSPLG